MAQKLRIMIVDDDWVTLEVTAAVLENAGHQVLKRKDALGTLSAIAKERPNIVLLDVNMPGLGGDKLAELMMHKNENGALIILYSGSRRTDLQQLAQKCGAAGAIEKCADPELFLRKFNAVVSGAACQK